MTGFVEATLLAAALLAAVVWLGVVVLAPKMPLFPATSPLARIILARAWLYAPVWVPTLVLFATMVPGLTGAVMGKGDHCEFLMAHHHHLCLLHPPHSSNHLLTWMVPTLLGIWVVMPLARGVRRAWQQWRLAHSLLSVSEKSQLGADVRVLEDPTPLAVTVGWTKPTILLSRGLLSAASAQTLNVILLHERAHMYRHDIRWAMVDQFFANLLPTKVAASLLQQIGIAREQACDRAAADRVGDAMVVANALLEVARLRFLSLNTGLSIVSGSLEQRVRHLVQRPSRCANWPIFMLFFLIVCVLAGAGVIHTLVESAITLLIH